MGWSGKSHEEVAGSGEIKNPNSFKFRLTLRRRLVRRVVLEDF